jgi:hypothetical protein
MSYNGEDMVGMSEEDMMEQDKDFFNDSFPVGSKVLFYPRVDKIKNVIPKNVMKTYTESTSFIVDGKTLVFLCGIVGAVPIHKVKQPSFFQYAGILDENFDHKW